MLSKLRNYLVVHGLVQQQDLVTLTVRLTGNWSVLCCVNDTPKYFIKVQQFQPLDNETRGVKLWHQHLPLQVPRLIHQGKIGEQNLYIQEAQWHRRLCLKSWLHNLNLQQELFHFFDMCHQYSDQNKYQLNLMIMERLSSYTQKITLELFNQLQLPKISQHGDLTLTNLGYSNHLLIFDWEDYGESDFPLLDLTTFLLSLYEFNMQHLFKQVHHQSISTWLDSCLSLYSLSISQFLQSLPYSLAVFLQLKEHLGYGKEVIEKTKRALIDAQQLNQELSHA